MPKISLPSVTLCAVTSINLEATMMAMARCLDQAEFGATLLLTDVPPCPTQADITVERISHLGSSAAYSHFMLEHLRDHIRTEHCLVIQWDGYVLDSSNWDPAFLKFDYIGAPWPQFSDTRNVGNGGFSLRSMKLMEACASPGFHISHPEDLAICHKNRSFLEHRHGIRFADMATASKFSCERGEPGHPTFGFHGIFRMIPTLGAEAFWQTYMSLDDKSTAYHDYALIMRDLGQGRRSFIRRMRFTLDYLRHRFPLRRADAKRPKA